MNFLEDIFKALVNIVTGSGASSQTTYIPDIEQWAKDHEGAMLKAVTPAVLKRAHDDGWPDTNVQTGRKDKPGLSSVFKMLVYFYGEYASAAYSHVGIGNNIPAEEIEHTIGPKVEAWCMTQPVPDTMAQAADIARQGILNELAQLTIGAIGSDPTTGGQTVTP